MRRESPSRASKPVSSEKARVGFRAAALVVLAAATLTAAVSSTGAQAASRACKPYGTLSSDDKTVHFCGPATAHLSVFPGVTFKGGTCTTKPDGNVIFELKIGTVTQDARHHNRGLPYFAIQITGSLSHPTGGEVIASWKGRLWVGAGTSFTGNANAGSFTARGATASSHGSATGGFHC